jgi:lipoteichoic acid synthase
MHHLDGALAGLLTRLREHGRLSRTLVVVYGDHVTGMGEPPPVLALAGRPAWDPSVHVALHRVPVFIWVGDGSDPSLTGPRSTVGGQIDIGATVLHLLGIEDPRPAAWGRTLLDPDPGFAALSDGSAVSSELLLVARGQGIGREGGCFTRPQGRSVPLARCESLRRRARAELSAARLVPEHDLQRTPTL